MNVEAMILEVDKVTAQGALKEYRDEVKRTHHALDMQILRGYRAIARGKRLINLTDVLKAAGMNDNGYPRLGVARADSVGREVGVDLNQDGSGFFYTGALWRSSRQWRRRVSDSRVYFPARTFPWEKSRSHVVTTVPLVPPAHRPARGLANYHILFEVTRWNQTVPKDPALIRHLGGDLWVLVSVWDLTELERAVLASNR